MALLGKLIDVSTFSFAGVAMAGVPSQATVVNSLPAAADMAWIQLNSAQGVTSGQSYVALLVQAIGANTVTIGQVSTGASSPVLAGTLYAMVAYSAIK